MEKKYIKQFTKLQNKNYAFKFNEYVMKQGLDSIYNCIVQKK